MKAAVAGMTAAATLLAGGVAAWTAARAQYRPASALSVLTDADDGRVLRLPVGAELAVRLPENEGTNYRWMLRNEPRVESLGASTTDGPDNRGIVGGRRFRTFRLRLREPGRFALIFGLRAMTQAGEEAPARRVLFTVDAFEGGRGPTPRPSEWQDDSRWSDSDGRGNDRRGDDRPGDDRRGDNRYDPGSRAPLVLGEADSRRGVAVAYGREIVIRVPVDPDPANRWQLSLNPTNIEVLQPLAQGNGVASIRVRPLLRGSAHLAFVLMRPQGRGVSKGVRFLDYNFTVR